MGQEVKYKTKYVQTLNGKWICYKCQQYKPITLFDKTPRNNYRNHLDRRCKSCKRHQREIRRIQNRGDCGIERLLTERFAAINTRARALGLRVDIDRQYLKNLWEKQHGLCAISGLPMTTIVFQGRIPTNISVDRIDSNKGYIKGNIQLVCSTVNQMKNDLSQSELLYFCTLIIKNAKSFKH